MSKMTTTIKAIHDEAAGVKTFALDKPDDFKFTPGQYCWLSLPDTDYDPAPMAIASGTEDEDLEFSIRAWGDLTHALFEKTTGDQVIVDGPYGTAFPVDNIQQDTKLYMIGGGTGVTPIRCLVKSLGDTGNKRIFYGAKTPEELLYQYEIPSWPAATELTVDTGNIEWTGKVGLVTKLLEPETFVDGDLFFVCGPQPMEQAVVDFLRSRKITDQHIFVSLEKFDDEGNVIGPVLPVTDSQVEF